MREREREREREKEREGELPLTDRTRNWKIIPRWCDVYTEKLLISWVVLKSVKIICSYIKLSIPACQRNVFPPQYTPRKSLVNIVAWGGLAPVYVNFFPSALDMGRVGSGHPTTNPCACVTGMRVRVRAISSSSGLSVCLKRIKINSINGKLKVLWIGGSVFPLVIFILLNAIYLMQQITIVL